MNHATSPSNALAPAPSVWRTLRAFPRPVWFLFLGTFINRFGTFVIPFLALHLTHLGFSPRQCGLALTVYGVGHLIASAIGGHLADSIGRRRTIILSMIAGAICMLCLSQARELWAILTIAFLTGATGEFYRPASSALLADLTPAGQRITAYAAYRFAINAGFAFGPAIAGFLAGKSYLVLFVGDALTSLLFGAIAFAWLPVDDRHGARLGQVMASAVQSLRETARVAWREPRFVQLVVASFGIGMVFLQMPSTLGLDIKARGYADSVYGLVLALNGILIVAFEIPLTTWTQRHDARAMTAAGYFLIGLSGLAFGLARTPVGYGAAMALMTLGEMVSMPVAFAYVASLAPPDMRGRYMGIYSLTWAAALMTGPGIGMSLFQWKPAALWLTCALVGLASTAVMAVRPRACSTLTS